MNPGNFYLMKRLPLQNV